VSPSRKILVTAALPYANNSLHIGHMVEYIQTDVWVRFQRMRGHICFFACASDAHGTPTMLRAEEEKTTPEALLERIYEEHKHDFATFRISVDNYLTTHAPENRELTELLYTRLVDNGYIRRNRIKQAYDDARGMFLPDRYVRGTCPVCSTPDQYGDSCESCGATYSPLELKDARSTVSGSKPSIKESEHLFLKLGEFESELRQWVTTHVDPVMVHKLDEWFAAGLKDWDISRDAPYFGFEIPGERDKYFYVWFDALIGYMSSFLNLCRRSGIDFDDYWAPHSQREVYHFIGKDIVYFHTLYWPAMLGGAGFRRPSGVFAHGFLTVDGQKMSKRRGTFIMASKFAKHVDPDYLRYYFASKLGPAPDDIDLNLADFVAKVNSDLVGKFVNIGSRCAGFIHRLNDGKLGADLADRTLFDEFASAGESIAEDFESRNYARAMRRIMQLTDAANQYIDERKPWVLAKDPARKDAVISICTLGINLFRTLAVYLKPVVPSLVERIESFLAAGELRWQDAAEPLLYHSIQRFETLLKRVESTQVEAILADHLATEAPAEVEFEEAQKTDEIDISLFSRIDLRIAEVTDARYVDGADKLLELKLNTGDGERTVFSGIRSAYEPDALIGRHVVLLANLRPRKMRFGLSEGMILAAGGESGEIFLLSADAGVKPGMKVT
jgi:methionyl-tRNA synthetase